jgi:hypothetical protein
MQLSHAHASQRHIRSCQSPMNVKITQMFHVCRARAPLSAGPRDFRCTLRDQIGSRDLRVPAAERDVHVPHDPRVERRVPLPPAAAARAGRRARPGTAVCQAILPRAPVQCDVARRVLRSRSSLSASNHLSIGGLADQKPAKVQLLCTQRCMLSGTSIPSSIAHTRKKRQIERNCRARARALSASSGGGARQDSGLRWLRGASAAYNGPDLEIHEPERHVAAPSNLPPGHHRVSDGIPRAVVVHRHVAAPAHPARQRPASTASGLSAVSRPHGCISFRDSQELM